MGTINICNSKGHDSAVGTRSVSGTLRVRWVDSSFRQVGSQRLLKSTIDKDSEALARTAGSLEKVSDLLVSSDPEIDIESFGSFLKDVSRVYIDPDQKLVHRVQEWEILRNPDGSEKERRPKKIIAANVATEIPLKWTGKLLKKKDVYNRFVFAGKVQLVHVNGLTYEFLHGIAKELEEKDSLLLVGAGPKSNQPLIFQRNGTPYRGFLEGRTRDKNYCLILHLSNMELKAPEPKPQEGA
jgi:hypothetical protein